MPAEYGINGFRRIIQKATLNLRDQSSLTAKKTDILLEWPSVRSYSHITSAKSKVKVGSFATPFDDVYSSMNCQLALLRLTMINRCHLETFGEKKMVPTGTIG